MKDDARTLFDTSLLEDFQEQLESAGFTGDIDFSRSSRVVYATDNSVYQQEPAGILFPRITEDVQRIARIANVAKYKNLTFTPRGGGTGTNGQSLTTGLVVDMSRHMTRILEFDKDARRVKVQAGVIKDALNDYLKPHGLFFSPDLSTSNRAVIGGMISTDASGQGSLRYGKTSDHIVGLRCITMDGEVLDTDSLSLSTAAERASGDSTEAKALYQLMETVQNHQQGIAERFPDLNRFLTGYDLNHAYQDDRLDLTRLICGSEGTLVFIAEAWLDLDEISQSRTLVNINYDSFEAALRSAPAMLEAQALSVETVDSTVLNLAREDVVWQSIREDIDDAGSKKILGLNMVEFAGNDADEEGAKVRSLCESLDALIDQSESGVLGYRVCEDLASIQRVYGMRKKSVGLLGNMDGAARPMAFVEDTCVPPSHLADYIMEFRALLDRKGLRYGMFGHVDCGVLHVRPALDLTEPPQQLLLKEISDEVAALTAKYGGLMWGEHGRGFRSEYGPTFFGETLFNELRKIKAAFDPKNRLNPGKICTPWRDEHSRLVRVDGPFRGSRDVEIPSDVRESYSGPMQCNGNGLCFSYDTSSAMCPSYKATGDRRQSPKGRAALLREWLRMEHEGSEGLDDFSNEVAEALNGCLACKACSTACPIKVDISTYRSRFFQHYYKAKRRPIKDYLVGFAELYVPWMARLPAVMNLLVNNRMSASLTEKFVGMSDLPSLSAKGDLGDFRALKSVSQLERLTKEERKRCVCVVPDPFTLYYEADKVRSLLHLIRGLGKEAVLLPFQPNGKPQHVKGFLSEFERTAINASKVLNRVSSLDIPMVGLDPAMVLCYRDEYREALGERRGDFRVLLPQEWLLVELEGRPPKDEISAGFRLLSHCTERALVTGSDQQWKAVFKHFGVTLDLQNTGCCGMSGSFGHDKANLDTSRKVYAQSWRGLVESDSSECLATGYSCRHQVERFSQKNLRHPIQALLEIMDSPS